MIFLQRRLKKEMKLFIRKTEEGLTLGVIIRFYLLIGEPKSMAKQGTQGMLNSVLLVLCKKEEAISLLPSLVVPKDGWTLNLLYQDLAGSHFSNV